MNMESTSFEHDGPDPLDQSTMFEVMDWEFLEAPTNTVGVDHHPHHHHLNINPGTDAHGDRHVGEGGSKTTNVEISEIKFVSGTEDSKVLMDQTNACSLSKDENKCVLISGSNDRNVNSNAASTMPSPSCIPLNDLEKRLKKPGASPESFSTNSPSQESTNSINKALSVSPGKKDSQVRDTKSSQVLRKGLCKVDSSSIPCKRSMAGIDRDQLNMVNSPSSSPKKKKRLFTFTNSPCNSHTHDTAEQDGDSDHTHIFTERERRKKMRSLYTSLQTLLGLPKADKAAVVEAAIIRIHALQATKNSLQRQKLAGHKPININAGGGEQSSASFMAMEGHNMVIINKNPPHMNKNPKDPCDALPLDDMDHHTPCFEMRDSIQNLMLNGTIGQVIMNVSGCTGMFMISMPRFPSLLSTIFTALLNNSLEVLNAHLSSSHDNICYSIHAKAQVGSIKESFNNAYQALKVGISSFKNLKLTF